jgi:hypothetical protein
MAEIDASSADKTAGSDKGREIAQVRRPELSDLTFTLVPGALRGSGTGRRALVLPANASSVTFQMVLTGNDYQSYDAAIRTPEGHEILTSKRLRSRGAEDNKVVVWRVPSKFLHSGNYIVALDGQRDDLPVENVELYSLRVLRK